MAIIDLPPSEWNEVKQIEGPKSRFKAFKAALRNALREVILIPLTLLQMLLQVLGTAALMMAPILAMGAILAAIDWFIPLSYAACLVVGCVVLAAISWIIPDGPAQQETVSAAPEQATATAAPAGRREPWFDPGPQALPGGASRSIQGSASSGSLEAPRAYSRDSVSRY
jgi:cell division protein FtsW (lipid II flippase)